MSEVLKGSASLDNTADIVEELFETAEVAGKSGYNMDKEGRGYPVSAVWGPNILAKMYRSPGSYEINRPSSKYEVVASASSGTYQTRMNRDGHFRGRPFFSSDTVTRTNASHAYKHVYGEHYKERASFLITRLAVKYAIRGCDSDIEERKAKLQAQMDAVAEFSTTLAQI